MPTIALKELYQAVLPNEKGDMYIQLTGLAVDGSVWTMGNRGKWVPLSMEIESTEERAAAAGIKVVN
jgi:hypothetical protein